MTYLLDTNIVSGLMRADTRIEDWISRLGVGDRIVTCTVVRGEILFGISRLDAGRRRTEIEVAADRLLALFHCEVIPVSAADTYAELKLSRRRMGLSLDENDLWIAATAISLDATLVSRDQDFDGIEGLRLSRP